MNFKQGETVEFLWNTEIREILGDTAKGVTGIRIFNN